MTSYEKEKPDKVFSEDFLTHEVGFLKYFELERLHIREMECPILKEDGNPKYHKVRTVKRGLFSLHAISKSYETPKVSSNMRDVRAENDAVTQSSSSVNDNRYILKVYDSNIYCTIYEHYIFNLEEACLYWKKGNHMRKDLGSDVINRVKKKNLILKGECTTIHFRNLMMHTLGFLDFLHRRELGYGGLHPHNILIVDEECTIKFKGFKNMHHLRLFDQDKNDFIRLVRFCAHGGVRDIKSVFNDSISKEALDFLMIFDDGADINRQRHYTGAFHKNRLNFSKHPLFWDESMCLNYFLQTHALLKACNLTSTTFSQESPMIPFQNLLNRRISNIKKDIQGLDLESTNPSDPTQVINGIIKGIRNIEGHFPDGIKGVLGNLGEFSGFHPREFWKELRRRFPGLITGVHKIILSYQVELSPLFPDHWEKFYPCV